MFFKNIRSRKKMIKEIEELKKEIERLNELKQFYKSNYYKFENLYESVEKRIKTIGAYCISESDDFDNEKVKTSVTNYLCKELAKEMLPYISYEKHTMMGEFWNGEEKHIATIKIIED